MSRPLRFGPGSTARPGLSPGDGLILLGLGALAYALARLAFHAPAAVRGPEIVLSGRALPWYALLSVGRMAVAYVLSLAFSLAYGYVAARNARARALMMPLLDVLQSVPILSFLPVVLLGLAVVMPEGWAAEVASIVLIFTSQAWNMTFSFYQSVSTVPTELREAAAVFRFGRLLRFRTLELPFAAVGLVWNSMMSWSGGWFFLMAAEIFNVGARDFRLPGLGSYLQVAAAEGDLHAVLLGVTTLVLIVVALDQFVWRPVLAWAERFKVEMVASEDPPASWFLDVVRDSWIVQQLRRRALRPVTERLDRPSAAALAADPPPLPSLDRDAAGGRSPLTIAVVAVFALLAIGGALAAVAMISSVPARAWLAIGTGLLATLARVVVSLVIALLWTVPVGVAIGTSPRLARVLGPTVQVLAAIPATALFPVLVALLLKVPGGLNLAAILLMLMGTQWYLLFNVIAGASAIPQDLRDTTDLLRLSRVERWRTLVLPAVFPYIVTGSITAGGGAWNASIVAEYVQFAGRTLHTTGVGAVIADATANAHYPVLLAATLALVLAVVLINRLFWQRLYRRAEERYRLD